MYKASQQASAGGAGPGPGTDASGAGADGGGQGKEGVVDADFEEVDEKRKSGS
jgi:molecular chaperone DnaK